MVSEDEAAVEATKKSRACETVLNLGRARVSARGPEHFISINPLIFPFFQAAETEQAGPWVRSERIGCAWEYA